MMFKNDGQSLSDIAPYLTNILYFIKIQTLTLSEETRESILV